MSTPDITRSTASKGLAHVMDARGANLEQNALLYNPSPEVDSLAELPAELLRQVRAGNIDPALFATWAKLSRRLLESNIAEGASEMTAAGLLEDHIARARTAPLAARMTAKSIARRLRDPLRVMLDPAAHDAIEFFRAAGAIRDVLAACPREQLLAPAVEHHLGGRKFRLLTQLFADFEGSRA